jgi:hypothetical protein
MNLRMFRVVAVGSSITFAPLALAGTIIQPTSATTGMGTVASPGYSPTHVIDQTGLTAPYTSGVTNFDTFVPATKTTAGGSGTNSWFSAAGNVTGNFDFDLGAPVAIESFALWPDPQTGAHQGPKNFNLIGSLDAAFTTPLALGSYVATEISGDANNAGQIFGFTPTVARHVRMQITSNYGSASFTGMVEAAFEQSVPEPATPALLMTALAGICIRRRRGRARASE